jgi:phosphomannomutase
MAKVRNALPVNIGEFKVTSFDDLAKPKNGLPPTDGVRIWLDNKYRVIVRPSGTEPKIKCYIEVTAKDEMSAKPILDLIEGEFRELMKVT